MNTKVQTEITRTKDYIRTAKSVENVLGHFMYACGYVNALLEAGAMESKENLDHLNEMVDLYNTRKGELEAESVKHDLREAIWKKLQSSQNVVSFVPCVNSGKGD